jgi:hypothetical protein
MAPCGSLEAVRASYHALAGRRRTCVKQRRKSERLVALALLGFLLFNYPLLSLFSTEGSVLGIPVLYAYLFASWGLLIGLMALVVRKSG